MARLTIFLWLLLNVSICLAEQPEEKQYIEVREYRLKSADAAKQVDEYLIKALIPALNRMGTGPVGVFREETEQSEPIRYVVIAYSSIADFAGSASKLSKDVEYQEQAADYMARNQADSPLVRIRSELLHSFDCWPAMKVPDISKNEERIFELRIYESSNERFGDLKVEMFNAGEVPIFLDSGIVPIFMGQAKLGGLMPNLTYMTVYPNQQAKDQGWENFFRHPDWKKLSALPKYKGSVSKVHKINLLPVKGSQL